MRCSSGQVRLCLPMRASSLFAETHNVRNTHTQWLIFRYCIGNDCAMRLRFSVAAGSPGIALCRFRNSERLDDENTIYGDVRRRTTAGIGDRILGVASDREQA